jgi:hypothetical protein
MKRTIFLVCMSVAVAACAVTAVQPLAVPLAYKPASNADTVLKTLSCASVAQVQVEDKRGEKILGTRFLENKPVKADVTAASDPAPWVRSGVESFMAQNGFKMAPAGAKLVIDLESLKTSENVWHRSGYEARILLGATLRSPSGKTCWQDSLEGKSGNYGYSGSIENYQETLNGALDAATLHMLESSSFTTALCRCAG